uniref:Ig-like domain-containing protein n=1 Tax=Periophthalmus magnuspinnatus TaxID=409849 RepID=A0A3B3ZI00_9GOBI
MSTVCSGAVTVKVTPTIEVIKGEMAKLPCTHTVSPSTSSSTIVEWFIELDGNRKRVAFRQGGQSKTDEDTPLSNRGSIGEDFTLTITSVQPSDEVKFYCQVTAGPAGVGEAATELKVFCECDLANVILMGICVTRNGHPQPRIIWFKDDQPLPEVKDREQKTYMVPSLVKEASGLFTLHSKLYMNPTKADKDSEFYCMVEYKLTGGQVKQKKSDSIKINLNYPSESATFSLLNTAPVKEGDTVTMKCETDGNPQPEFEFTKDVREGGMLVLKSVKRTDAGTYQCTAIDFDNLDAELNGKISLVIHHMLLHIDPVSVTPTEPQVVMLGDKVEWQCKTKGSAPHTVQWKKGSEVLSQDGTLSIQEISYEKAGEYMCVGAVPSVPGLESHASVNLTVKGKPMIETPAIGEVAKEGDMVTLKCASFGFPAPQFTWKPAGKESVMVENNKVVSSLTLQATPDIMKSGVSCEVKNEHGTDQKMISVALKRANNNADRGSAFSLLLLSSLLISGLFIAQSL